MNIQTLEPVVSKPAYVLYAYPFSMPRPQVVWTVRRNVERLYGEGMWRRVCGRLRVKQIVRARQYACYHMLALGFSGSRAGSVLGIDHSSVFYNASRHAERHGLDYVCSPTHKKRRSVYEGPVEGPAA